MKSIHLRNVPGDPETYDHISMIDHMANWIKPESYLEIGVRDGKSLNVVSKHAKLCYAVDMNFLHKDFDSNVITYEMLSDDPELAEMGYMETACIATINLPDEDLEADEVIIKDYSENEGIYDCMLEAGHIAPASRYVKSGFITAPVSKLLLTEKS